MTTRGRKTPARNPELTVRTAAGDEFPLYWSEALERAAMTWSYIVRQRLRWKEAAGARSETARNSRDELRNLGLEPEQPESIGTQRLVEIRIPYVNEQDRWAARIMPWEYLLSSATRETRAGRDLTVVRHLRCDERSRNPGKGDTAAVLISAPGAIGRTFDFSNEGQLLPRNLDLDYKTYRDPTLDELRTSIARDRPDVIHVGGLSHYRGRGMLGLPGRELQKGQTEEDRYGVCDGMYLADAQGEPVPVEALNLARALNAAETHKHRLVVYNLHRSGPRVAALTVAERAEVAIGFQDAFDDLAAEQFIAAFYQAWSQSDGDALVAFEYGFRALGSYPGVLEGSGIVLWSAYSLVEAATVPVDEGVLALSVELDKARERPIVLGSREEALEGLDIRVKPLENLNYALLHNRQPLFQRFEISTSRVGRIESVNVEVELLAGAERLPFFGRFSVGPASQPLHKEIFIPLTSTLVRNLREGIRASLRVKVSVGDSPGLYDRTYRITLLPVNEWVDNDEQRQWLPSFVFPQDPVIKRIIDRAQRYLMSLTDDPLQCFDGYQSVDRSAEDPTERVDAQVAAIWAALLHETPLYYINPPPTYSRASQCLRTPRRRSSRGGAALASIWPCCSRLA